MREAERGVGFSAIDQACTSVLWFGFFTQWLTIPTIILPSQVARIHGQGAPNLTLVTGAIIAAGGVVALIVPPLAGALSDHVRAPRGRRRPFLIAGVLASCLGLGLLARAGEGGDLVLYTLAYLNLQLWWNWAAGPYAGLIPDIVPEAARGEASAWMNGLSTLGVIVGNLLVIRFYEVGRPVTMAAIFAAIMLACLAATLAGTREPPAAGLARPGGPGPLLRLFCLSPRRHPAFYLVLVTRLVSNMGIWSILTFLLFYFITVLGLDETEATRLLPALLGGGALLSIPASLVAVRLADRWGVVRIVQATSWVMALATIGCLGLAFRPSLPPIVAAVLVFSVANGAYGAADWYLALQVLPKSEHAGKDFGIWHVCMVLPQIVGPVTTGWLIAVTERAVSPRFAYQLAFGIAAFWFVLAAILVARVRLPART